MRILIAKRLDGVFDEIYYDGIVNDCTLSMQSITVTEPEKQDSSKQHLQIEPVQISHQESLAPPYSSTLQV